MTRRRYLVGGLAVVGALAVAGCSGNGASNNTTTTSRPGITTTAPTGNQSARAAAANVAVSNAIRHNWSPPAPPSTTSRCRSTRG